MVSLDGVATEKVMDLATSHRRGSTKGLDMRLHSAFLVITIASASLGAFPACGGKTASESPPSAPSAEAPMAATSASAPEAPSAAPAEVPSAAPAEEAVVGPPKVAWKDMTKPQRAKYMKAAVLPKMRELFTAFDAKAFPEVNCKTCHGKGMEDHSFKMPNPDIAQLPADKAGFMALMKKKPEWVKFMMEKVKPTMTELLGLEAFEPEHPKPDAFGCQNCHTSKGK